MGTYAASAASPSITQVVNQDPTAAAVISSLKPSAAGQSVTYTVSVTAASPGTGNPTGSVGFFDGAAGVSGCMAKVLPGTSTDLVTCVVPYANTVGGPHSITAQYLGNTSTYSASAVSTSISQVVAQSTTTSVVGTSGTPSVVGLAVTYPVTVTATGSGTGNLTGSVEFFDGGSAISGCAAQPASGTAADTDTCVITYLNTTNSPHSITAPYLGNAGIYAPSAVSSAITQTVNQAGTATSVATSLSPSSTDQQVTYRATVTATGSGSGIPTGNVEFFDGGTAITVCGGTTGLTLGGSATANCAVTYTSTGRHTIIAKYLGNTGTYAVSALSSSITQTVSASSAVTGSSAGNLVTGTDYYQLPSASAGSASSMQNSFSAGTAATLTSFTFTISSSTAANQTATIGSISGSSWTATGLTCAITGGSGLKTSAIVSSVPISGANSVNLQVGCGGGTGVSGTWTTAYTVPQLKVKGSMTVTYFSMKSIRAANTRCSFQRNSAQFFSPLLRGPVIGTTILSLGAVS